MKEVVACNRNEGCEVNVKIKFDRMFPNSFSMHKFHVSRELEYFCDFTIVRVNLFNEVGMYNYKKNSRYSIFFITRIDRLEDLHYVLKNKMPCKY